MKKSILTRDQKVSKLKSLKYFLVANGIKVFRCKNFKNDFAVTVNIDSKELTSKILFDMGIRYNGYKGDIRFFTQNIQTKNGAVCDFTGLVWTE